MRPTVNGMKALRVLFGVVDRVLGMWLGCSRMCCSDGTLAMDVECVVTAYVICEVL